MTNVNLEDYKGYRGVALNTLQKFKTPIWSDVEIITDDGSFKGLILPRSETADEFHIVLKMQIGYNIGIAAEKIRDVKIFGRKEAHYKIPEKDFPYDPKKPRVKLLGTGGTIASRLDYRTGAVIPAFSPGELYGSVPELADICNLETEKLYGVFSENMGPEQWIGLAEAIGKEIEKGVQGIVIGHGTDTMHHTAAILSFMVQNSPVPIVMVGSQRSSDRPSSDAALNLIHSVTTAAISDIAEVMVCMFGPTSDLYGLLHRGTRVRKMHSSYRSTFRTIGDIPIATVSRDKVTPIRDDYKRRKSDNNVKVNAVFDDGVAVYMTVQTLWGYVQMYVYATGRDMMELGVVPAANMLPEVAYMKLGWAFGQTDDIEKVKEIMLTPITGEITEREPSNGYLIYQGGLPEVEEFIKLYRK